MDKNSVVIGAIVIAVVGVVGGMVWSAEKDKHKEDNMQVVAMATAAQITIDEAIQTALNNFPGKVIEAELNKKHDKTVWVVDILTAETAVMAVHVDAESGSVVTTEEKLAGRQQ